MAKVVITIEDLPGGADLLPPDGFLFHARCISDPVLPVLADGTIDDSCATGAQLMGQVAMKAIRELMVVRGDGGAA